MIDSQLAALFFRACEIDMHAIKPGNVGLHSGGHGMQAADFIRSAQACAPAICRPGLTLGERILDAVKATRTAVDCNTNLGIILLCAPLIHTVLEEGVGDLRRSLEQTLSASTVADSVLVYRAIRMAVPGNMGHVEESDLSEQPTISLRAAMRLARERDLIAMQYVDGYCVLFDEVVPHLLEFQSKWGYAVWSVVGAYLALLGSRPDSLVARKYGAEKALEIRAEAMSLYESFAVVDRPEEFKQQLLEFDRRLKREGINPGTTADLVVTGFLMTSLRTLDQAGRNPLSRKDA